MYCAVLSAKADIIATDEREAGLRALLNLGHTFAHAFEAEADMMDGFCVEAVAAGICHAFALSRRMGLTDGQSVIVLLIICHELPCWRGCMMLSHMLIAIN